jgi:hypothetical protein
VSAYRTVVVGTDGAESPMLAVSRRSAVDVLVVHTTD